ncbi:hypothetical protein GKQ23_13025 [Erwinia sp. E602]|uniref:hypothetical protein n=1 Tax=Erwinia sp. E602 TaxID=2675378 RepID=UPI001BAB4236|nr:hypothetical protein [Erwinia sp. E602]QUG75859.1 hypothetical protein GKQ23_13025 [Erwinia sp. E602]
MADNRIRVDLDADVSPLERALRRATGSIDDFGSNAGGVIEDFAGNFSGGMSKAGLAATGLVGALAVSIGGFAMAVQSSRDYVKELNNISRSTGLSVTQLQQLQNVFQGLDLSIESFGSFNKDTLDKLGDAFRAGGGVGDDLKEYGLNLQDFNRYLNQTDGGLKAVIHTFYEMQKAGKTQAEIVNVMETLASDSSHLIPVLKELGTEQNALSTISQAHAGITNEAAQKYAEFEKKVDSMTGKFQQWQANALAPTVAELSNLLDVLNQDWTGTKFADFLEKQGKQFLFSGDNGIAKGMRKLFDQADSDYDTEAGRNLNNLVDNFVNDVNKATEKKKVNVIPTGGWVDVKGEADKAEAAAKAAAAKAKALQEKNDRERLKAQETLNKAISDSVVGSNARQLAEFDRQQKELIAKVQEAAKTLGLSQADTLSKVQQVQEGGAYKKEQMINGMIGYTDPNQGIKDQNSLIASGQLNQNQTTFLANQQNQRINGDNPFSDAAKQNTDQQLTDNNAAMQAELAQNDLLLKGHEDYEKMKSQITAKYNAQAMTISQQNAQAQLSIFSNASTQLTGLMVDAFGEGSGAAKAAFAVQKGIAMAQTILSLQSAMATALASGPFPSNIPAYLQVATLGMSIISTARSAASGQFHGGIDSVPSNLDNKSFVLKAGERVIMPQQNKRLTQFLDEQDSTDDSTSSNGDTVINAPFVVQGNVRANDQEFNDMLKQYNANVMQAVKNAERRNS